MQRFSAVQDFLLSYATPWLLLPRAALGITAAMVVCCSRLNKPSLRSGIAVYAGHIFVVLIALFPLFLTPATCMGNAGAGHGSGQSNGPPPAAAQLVTPSGTMPAAVCNALAHMGAAASANGVRHGLRNMMNVND